MLKKVLPILAISWGALHVGGVHGQTPSDPCLVSFSQVDFIQRPSPAVKLGWNLYGKAPGQDYFEEIIDSTLQYILTINDEPIVVRGNRFIYEKNLSPGLVYRCHIALFPNQANYQDVTEYVNDQESKKYNSAQFRLVITKSGLELVWLRELWKHVKDFFDYGGVLGIAPILTFVFIIGLICFLFYFVKLFCLPKNWGRYILNSAKAFDNGRNQTSHKGPIAKIEEALSDKLKMYDMENTQKVEEEDSHKLIRIEKSLKDTVAAELNGITSIELSRLAGRRGKKVVDFFFSIEHFWHFGVIAPFLGLLGTVTGISKAFGTVGILTNLTELKNVLTKLSSGINEALYTTIGGLIVGIFFIGVYYLFIWRLDEIRKALDRACDLILKKVERREYFYAG